MSTPARIVFADDPSIAHRSRRLNRSRRTALLIAYPVLVVVVIIAAILLGAYESNRAAAISEQEAREAAAPKETPAPPPSFHVPSVEEMEVAFNPELVTVDEAGHGMGTRVEATTTAYAEQNPELLAEHLQQVLESTCINNLSLRTSTELGLDFWDYCYNAPAAKDIAALYDVASEPTALSLYFAHYPTSNEYTEANVIWEVGSDKELDTVVKSWEDAKMPKSIDRVNFAARGVGELDNRSAFAKLSNEGLEHRPATLEEQQAALAGRAK